MRTVQPAGVAAITVTAVLWGTTGTAATFAPGVGPLAIGAAALGIGGLLQAAIALPAIREAAPALRTRASLVLFGALAVAVYPLAFYSSMALAGVAVGSVASLASAPLASGALERLLDHRPLSRWWLIAAAIGIVGATLLCAAEVGSSANAAPGLGGPGHDGGAGAALTTLAGIGLGLVAGASYASYSWVVHRLMAGGVRRSASMGAVFGIGGALLMPVLLATGAPILESRESFLVAAYMALVPMFLGYVLFGFGLTRVAPSTATTITLTEPAVATVLAVVIVGEALNPAGWAGLACIAVVLLILAVAPANATPATQTGDIRTPV